MNISFKNCLKIGGSVFLLYLCIYYWKNASELFFTLLSAALPLFIGFFIAYIVNILMEFYEKHYFPKSKKHFWVKSRRPVCIIGAFLSLIAIVLLITGLVIPKLVSCVQLIFTALPDGITFVIQEIDKFELLPESITDVLSSVDWKSRIGKIIEMLTSGFGNIMDIFMKTISSVFSGIVTGLISIIFSIYLLISKEKLKAQLKKLIKHYTSKKISTKITYVAAILNDCFRRYIIGQCTEAVILGVLCTLGMMLLRLPYATMIGALVAFTALIPIAGAYIGAIVGAFMILTVSPLQALVFLIFLVILQQLEGNLIYPKVVGSSIGLPGIWVLAAVTVGGGIMGVFGMILGVPLVAALYRIIRDDMNGNSELLPQKNKKQV